MGRKYARKVAKMKKPFTKTGQEKNFGIRVMTFAYVMTLNAQEQHVTS
jgi:hypothetical protein